MNTPPKCPNCAVLILILLFLWLLGGLVHLFQQDMFDPSTMTFRKWTEEEKAAKH